jgi:hypothetical protein
MMVKSYSELRLINTFEERFDYLSLRGQVGKETFGFDRWMNQEFYRSVEWRNLRKHVIARDEGCDLGVFGYEIYDRIYIHHMNPMTKQDLLENPEVILDTEFLICVTHLTHNAIHYGDRNLLRKPLVERRPGDTRLW